MLALCIHAARDAYIYANCVESHKALSKPGTPRFSLPFLLPILFSSLWRNAIVKDGGKVRGMWQHWKHTGKRPTGEILTSERHQTILNVFFHSGNMAAP